MATTVKTKGPTFSPDWRFQEPIAWRDTDLDEKTLKAWFNYILLGRQVDYRFQVLNRQGRAPFIISCAGHEAAQIGVSWPLKPKYDWVSPYYRDVVLCLRMGVTPLDLMLSVLAKPADPASGGKQTPGHFSDTRLNITSGGSPVATQLVRGRGRRVRAEDGRHRQGPDDVLRRGLGLGGRRARGLQLRRDPQGARDLRVREQRLRHLHSRSTRSTPSSTWPSERPATDSPA